MSEEDPSPAKSTPTLRALRVGFVPLADCAPLIMAKELGLFRKFGLNVVLSRELGWASVRDKIIYGELEAAHALVGMPVAATLGLGSIACDCLTALVLSLHGNAITLSNALWQSGARDGATLREEIGRLRGKKTLTFGVVYPFSSHHFLLRNWLAAAGVDVESQVRVVVVPPPQMVANLKAGHLDGFCVGEPWNSAAVRARAGWCVAASAELDPGHPEKVLMVRREFEETRPAEHRALAAAVLEACEFCQARENRDRVIATMARPEHVGACGADLSRGLEGPFDFGHDRVRTVPDFHVFHQGGANEPSPDKAAWVLNELRRHRLCKEAAFPASLGRKIFRPDIFEDVLKLQKGALNSCPPRALAYAGGKLTTS